MVRPRFIWTGGAALLTLALASPAKAQRATGPFSGLFGGTPSSSRTDGLDLRATVSGVYEDDILPAPTVTPVFDSPFLQNGPSGVLTGNLSYDHHGDRVNGAASGYGAYRQYSTQSGGSAVPYGGAASMTIKAARKLQLGAQADVSYSPFYQFGGVAGGGGDVFLAPAFAQSAVPGRNTSFDALLTATSALTPRSSVSASISNREARLLDQPGVNLQNWNGQVSYIHRLSRTLGWHANYGRGEARLDSTSAPIVNDTIDIGVDYGNTLSVSRRTAIAFATSTLAVRDADGTHYRLDGSVHLTRGMSRTWALFAGYDRSTSYQIGIGAPVLSDSVSAGINGLLSRRVKLTAQVSATRGAFGFTSDTSYTTASGSVRFEWAATRMLGWYTEYSYYRSQFPASDLAFVALPQFSRHIVTTGLTVWIPIVREASK